MTSLRRFVCSLAVVRFACMVPAFAQQTGYPFKNPALGMEQRIDNLLSLMTSRKKWIVLERALECRGWACRTSEVRRGSMAWCSAERRGGSTAPRSPTTQFPQPPGMGESWDPDLVRQAGAVQGYEARFITQTAKYNRQILMLWGPQADLARDPRWGRSEEVYGEDPFFNGTMAVALIKGLQGDDPKYWQSAALLKHFLANSNENLRDDLVLRFRRATVLGILFSSVPHGISGRRREGGDGILQRVGTARRWRVNPIMKSIVQEQWGVDVLSSDGGAVACW